MKHLYFYCAAALLPTCAASAQSSLPTDVTDGMYITVAEIRSNSMDAFQVFAGPEGGPISKQQFLSTQVPSSILPSQPEQQLLERLFSRLDTNGDGKVTLNEWNSRLDMDLQFADEDGNGKVTLKELARAKQNLGFGEAMGMVF